MREQKEGENRRASVGYGAKGGLISIALGMASGNCDV